MASANLDLVRSIYADWERGNFRSRKWAHPEIEYVIVDGSSRRRSTGLSGMAAAWRDFLADWEDWRAQTTDIRELDSERVLALVNLSGRNRASGLELAQIGSTEGANVFHVRNENKVTLISIRSVGQQTEQAFLDLVEKEESRGFTRLYQPAEAA